MGNEMYETVKCHETSSRAKPATPQRLVSRDDLDCYHKAFWERRRSALCKSGHRLNAFTLPM